MNKSAFRRAGGIADEGNARVGEKVAEAVARVAGRCKYLADAAAVELYAVAVFSL